MKRKQVKHLILLSFFIAAFSLSPLSFAEDEQEDILKDYVYAQPTMENLSKLYWALSMLDIENAEDVSNYVFINECDMFKQYFHHEFAWKGIYEAAKESLIKGKKNFPLRFQFSQPIQLEGYDFERRQFDLNDEYKIEGVRRFIVYAVDSGLPVCGSSYPIKNYRNAIILELSRPFHFKAVPVSLEKAETFIDKKSKEFTSFRPHLQKGSNLYNNREVYLVMKVKLFAYQGQQKTGDGFMPNILGVLEGYEVYADIEQKDLLFQKTYRKRRKIPAFITEGERPN